MKTKKKKPIYVHKCDWCNRELILNSKDSDSYVVTAEYKYFCLIQTPGKPAERDCMSRYLEEIKKKNEYPIKKKLEEEKRQKEKEEKEKAKRLEERPRVLAKLGAYQKELKQREIEAKLYANLHKWSTTKS